MCHPRILGLALFLLVLGIELWILYDVNSKSQPYGPVGVRQKALPPGGHPMAITEADEASLHDSSVHDINTVKRPPDMVKAMDLTGRFFVTTFARFLKSHETLEVRLGHASQAVEDQDFLEEGIGYTSLQLFRINPDGTVSPMGDKVELPPGIVFILGGSNFKRIDQKKRLTWLEYAPVDQPDRLKPANQADLVFLETKRRVQRPVWDRCQSVVGNVVYYRLLLEFGYAPGWNYDPSRPVRE